MLLHAVPKRKKTSSLHRCGIVLSHLSPTNLSAQGQIFEVPGDAEHAGTRFDKDIRCVMVLSQSHCSIAAQRIEHAWAVASHQA